MPTTFLDEGKALAPELAELRKTFHRYPELGNQEFETSRRIQAYLHGLGIETETLLETAVVGTLRGALPGPTVALRADMDALPVLEATGADFASTRAGIMHACGHDVHMTAALGAAKLLSAHRDTLRGTVKFFFQPDEEGNGGAARMIAAGCMRDVQAVFGCHVDPGLPLGTVGVRYGKFYAASDMFEITVLGVSAHGALREKGIDALGAAAELVTALLGLPVTLLPERSVVTVGTFHAGTANNILADRAELTGIMRTLGPESRETLHARANRVLEGIAAKTGTRCELRLRQSYSGVVNTDPETRIVQDAAEELLGTGRVQVLQTPTMTSEDFGCFVDASAGSFYHIGAGCSAPLHAADFLPQEEAIYTAAAVHAAVLWNALERVPKL